MQRSMDAIAALHSEALLAFEGMVKDADAEHLLKKEGSLVVFRERKAFAEAQRDLPTQSKYGIRSQILHQKQLREFDPTLSKKLLGGIFYPDAAHVLDPHAIVRSVADKVLADDGVYIQQSVSGLSPFKMMIGTCILRTAMKCSLILCSWQQGLGQKHCWNPLVIMCHWIQNVAIII